MASLRVPSSVAGRIGLVSATGSLLYVSYVLLKHRSLSRQVVHGRTDGAPPKDIGGVAIEIKDFKSDMLEQCDVYYDYSFKTVEGYTITKASEEHLTLLLRRNMKAFSASPQAWLFKWYLPNLSHTFSGPYIDSLTFDEGDIVCGVYRVAERHPHGASIMMMPPPKMGDVKGFLDISLRSGDQGSILGNQTFQLVPKGKSAPLKHAVPRFLHEYASWGLLVSGARYLQKLNEELYLQPAS